MDSGIDPFADACGCINRCTCPTLPPRANSNQLSHTPEQEWRVALSAFHNREFDGDTSDTFSDDDWAYVMRVHNARERMRLYQLCEMAGVDKRLL